MENETGSVGNFYLDDDQVLPIGLQVNLGRSLNLYGEGANRLVSIIVGYPKCIERALAWAIPNINFSVFSTEVLTVDSDEDGISNGEKTRAGEDGFITIPLLYDTGGVGLNDGVELKVGSDPT